MSGARADFIASLGKKITEARELLLKLESNLGGEERLELTRRIRVLGTSARLLQFPRVAEALARAEAALDAEGGLSFRSLESVGRIFDDLPALVWDPADPADREGMPAKPAAGAPAMLDVGTPLTILVIGPEPVAELLVEEAEARSARAVEVEREADPNRALDLARALAPDVIVIETSTVGIEGLVEALGDDPLTEPTPIIVVGSAPKERASKLLALGVQRTLTTPYSGETLMRTCEEVADQRHGKTARMPLGDPTVEQLGQRLADEVYRAIVMGVAPSARGERVSLGEGAEVLAAVWGAIARVREIVTVRTGGAVRFAHQGPEGAFALAPWLDSEIAAADRARVRGRGAQSDVRLEGRRVIVADDDPGVTWFIADLLRTTGCVVHEALDGKTALALAQRTTPDLVISDILMPELDGFALCRALRRDVALRDVPVILLSWKEDLLQRVRELGASAAAYLRKESDARAILARVREVLWSRARIEARLKGTGEIRGRLEGLTVRTLLELVSQVRGDARVSVRDASSLYEVEFQAGSPRRATLTSGDGSFARGERVLAAMLGVGAGRFVVGPPSSSVTGELSGSLTTLLEKPIAAARGALAALSGPRGAKAARVLFDAESLETYLHATPEPTRGLVVQLAQGASPKDLVVSGKTSATLLEDVIADLCARGMIIGVADETGNDLLGPEIEAALAILRAAPPRPPARSASKPPSARPPIRTPLPLEPPSTHQAVDLQASAPPSSLADAVMRELSERAGSATPPPVESPSCCIVEPQELKPRSNPPVGDETAPFELVREATTEPIRCSDPLIEMRQEDNVDLSFFDDLEQKEASSDAPLASEPTEVETIYEAEPLTATPPPSASKEEKDGPAIEPEVDSVPALVAAEPKKQAKEVKPVKPPSTGLGWFLLLATLAFGGVFMSLALTAATNEPADLDPPAGAELAPGEGILEISGPPSDIQIDGVVRGKGPRLVVTLQAGPHEIRSGEVSKNVAIAAGRMRKIDVSSP
jgi:CheY-like chemotaxis protein